MPNSARRTLRSLLNRVASGKLSVTEAMKVLAGHSFEDLGFAKVDHGRAARCGFPEVVLGEGKTPKQVVEVARRVHARSGVALITRTGAETQEALVREFGRRGVQVNEAARTVLIGRPKKRKRRPGRAVVACAGTSDIPVAEEAAVTARALGASVTTIYDIGIAGLERMMAHLPALRRAHVIIAVAGMEGALPSVIGGLVAVPVIAVPTSVGYGASFGGIAALLGMLNSCASNVTVVNIDDGFTAGYVAGLICTNSRG